MKKFVQEFKEFAMRGNVLDMAVGVVIGGAFSKIVSSLVENILVPALSLLTGKINLGGLAVTLATASGDAIILGYGVFLQNVLDFLLIALSIFLVIKLINRFHKKKEAPKAAPSPSKEEVLLTEIRDLLKEQSEKGE